MYALCDPLGLFCPVSMIESVVVEPRAKPEGWAELLAQRHVGLTLLRQDLSHAVYLLHEESFPASRTDKILSQKPVQGFQGWTSSL